MTCYCGNNENLVSVEVRENYEWRPEIICEDCLVLYPWRRQEKKKAIIETASL